MSLLASALVCLVLAYSHGAVIRKSGLEQERCSSWGPQYRCSSTSVAAFCGSTDWCARHYWSYDLVQDFPCTVAHQLVKNARGLIKESSAKLATEHDVALMIARACTLMKDYKARLQCKDLVTEEAILVKLVQLVDSKLTTQSVAEASGACTRKLPLKVKSKECRTCDQVVSSFQQDIVRIMSKEMYQKLVEPICAKFAHSQDMCQTLAKENYKKFVSRLSSASPAAACAGNTRCYAPSRSVVKPSANDECSICKEVVGEIRQLSRDQDIQNAIKSLLKSVCVDLGQFEQVCDTIADLGLEYLYELIATEMDPVVICEELHICGPASEEMETKNIALPVTKVKAGDLCLVCKLVLQELDAAIGSNATEEELKKELDVICDRLAGTFSKECELYVAKYSPLIIQAILQKLDPNTVCTNIGLCSGALDVRTHASKAVEAVGDDVLCNVCKLVVSYLDKYLQKNSTEAEIEALLDKVCTVLPGNLTAQCESLVKEYAPIIIQLLLQELQPTEVCTALALCTAEGRHPLRTSLKFKTPQKGSDAVCEICKYVFTYFDTYAEKNSTKEEIEAMLDKVCALLPASISQECQNLVKSYGPLLVELLLQELQPDTACATLGLCTAGGKDESKPNLFLAQEPSMTKEDFCPFCLLVMDELEQLLAKNGTESEIKAALDKVCDVLPKTLIVECENAVALYLPLIIELVVKEVTPSQICSTLGLCTSQVNAGKAHPLRAVQVSATPLCALCELVVQYLDGMLAENATESEIEAALDRVCDLLPTTLKQECESLVNQYTPTIIELFLAYPPESICSMLKLCASKKGKAHPLRAVQVSATPLCALCELVVQYLDGMLAENATESEIEAALDRVCDLLPTTLKQECEDLVNQYTPTIIELFLAYPPASICSMLKLCASKKGKAHPLRAVQVSATPLCALCELVVQYLDGMLAENATESEIEAALDRVCDLLPTTLKQECESLVNQYTPTIIELFLAYPPASICSMLKLCASKKGKAHPLRAVQVSATPLCALCELVVQYLDGMLAENATESEIEAALDRVCDLLPTTLKQECESLVNQYTPTIIELFLAYPPASICSMLKLCASKKGKAHPLRAVQVNATPLCALCELVVKYLDGMLAENATQSEIEAALDRVCDLLPTTLKQECESLVNQYTPTIIKLFLNVTPESICSTIGLCTSEKGKAHPLRAVQVSTTPLCALCELVVQYLDEMLAENATQSEIEAALDRVCDLLPTTLKQECESLVNQYTPTIIELFLAYPPESICSMLKLCTSKKGKAHPLRAVQVSTTPQCALCEMVVKYLDGMLAENATESEIEAALDRVCDLLPTTLKQECEDLVKQYTPTIIKLFLNFTPELICSTIGMCTSEKGKAHPLRAVQVSATPLCALCELVVQYLDGMLAENATESEIEAALDRVCDLLPTTLKQECEDLVKQYTPTIIKLFLNFTPESICSTIGLCTSEKGKAHPLRALQVSTTPQCALCEMVVKYLDGMLAENATESEIEAALDRVCDLLPTTLKQECEDLVKQYTPTIIKLFLNFTPELICSTIGMCTSEKGKAHPLRAVQVSATPLCALCELVVQYLDGMLAENATESEIEAALDRVCDLLPTTLKQECESLVKQYTPTIIKLFLNFTPESICSTIGLCTSEKGKAHPLRAVPVSTTPLCALCEQVVQYLDGMLAENATQSEIEAALDRVCDLLPTTLKQECESLVNQYTPTIIELFLAYPPASICSMLKLCASKKGKAHPLRAVQVSTTPQCALCEMVVKYLDGMLAENATESEIEAALDRVCDILPTTLKQECEDLVNQYTPTIIKLFLNFTPELICSTIGMCTSEKGKAHPLRAVQVSTTPQCTLCEMVVKYLDGMLAENATESEIEAALDRVCDILPTTLKQECEDLVKQYTPTIIKLFLNFTPELICSTIGLCTSEKVNIKPLSESVRGESPCDICALVMKYLDEILAENATEPEIEAALDTVCSLLPGGLKQKCDDLVGNYTPEIIKVILSIGPQSACRYMGLCATHKAVVKPLLVMEKSSAVNAGQLCAVCVLIANELDNALKQNSTQQEFVELLDKVCDILPVTLKDECLSFVNLYGPYVLKLLAVEIKPKELCTSLGLCSDSSPTPVVKPLLVMGKSSAVNAGQLCAVCELIANELDNALKQNSTQQEFVELLDKVCDILPVTLKDECLSFVDLYGPYVLKLLAVEIKPKELCTSLGLCSDSSPTLLQKKVKKTEDGTVCDICKALAEKLDVMLEANSTLDEAEAALDKVCDFMPKMLITKCEELVDLYTPQILNILSKEMNPDLLCTALRLCTSSKVKAQTEECVLCELIVLEVEKFIQDNATQAEVREALDAVCGMLPSALRRECVTMVKTYESFLIKFLIGELSPGDLCTILGLCNPGAVPAKSVTPKLNGVDCELCKYMMNKLKSMIGDKATEAEIEAALDKVCSLLPQELSAECKQVVDTYGPMIVKLLLELATPEEVCEKLGFCSPILHYGAVPAKVVTPNLKGVDCELCKYMMNKLKSMIGDKATEAEIEAALDKVCSLLPEELSAECKQVVDTYGPMIVKLLLELATPEEVCEKLGFCSPTLHYDQPKAEYIPAKVSETKSNCSTCKFLMYDLQNIMANSSGQAEAKAVLYELCKYFTYGMDLCRTLVNKNMGAISSEVAAFRFPINFCRDIRMCEPSASDQLPSEKPKSLTFESERKPAKTSKIMPYCSDCKFVMYGVQNYMAISSGQAEAKVILTEICKYFPYGMDVCRLMVDMNMEYITSKVTAFLFPINFCQDIALCEPPVTETNNPLQCDVCMSAVTTLDQHLRPDTTFGQAETILMKMCDSVVPSNRRQCETIVKKDTPTLLQLLTQYTDPSKVCQMAKLCMKTQTSPKLTALN